MADLPPLPQSDDPFELLQVDPKDPALDQRALKRAYVRRIKIYKPERDPVAFRRLREAYESAQSLLEIRCFLDEHDEEPAGPEPAPEPAPDLESDRESTNEPVEPPQPPAEVKLAWQLVAEGDGERAASVLRNRIERGDADPLLHTTLFLVEEASGASTREAGQVLTNALAAGVEVAGFAVEVLTAPELARLALDPACRWPRLREQANLYAAVELWRSRVSGLLSEGRADEVAREALEPEVVDDAFRFPGMGRVGLSTAVALAWDHPEAAQRVFDIHATDDGLRAEWSDESLYQELAELRQAWLSADIEGQALPLATLLKLGHVLEGELLVECLTSVQMDIRNRRWVYLRALEKINDADPMLLSIVHRVVEDRHGVVESFEDLSDAHRARIRLRLKELDSELERDVLSTIHNFALGIGAIMQIVSFFVIGWYGLVGIPILILLFASFLMLEKRLYRKTVRPVALEMLMEYPITPTILAAAIQDMTKLTDDIGRFDDDLEEDVALHALSWLLHVQPEEAWA